MPSAPETRPDDGYYTFRVFVSPDRIAYGQPLPPYETVLRYLDEVLAHAGVLIHDNEGWVVELEDAARVQPIDDHPLDCLCDACVTVKNGDVYTKDGKRVQGP